MSRLSEFLSGFGGGNAIGGMPIRIINNNTIIEPNTSVGIDTSQRGVEITLPANPLPGDRVLFFDAAMSWDKRGARIKLNGHKVEHTSVSLDHYLLVKKGGMQELLFVGDTVGWKDVSLYAVGAEPIWSGSELSNSYPVHSYDSVKNASYTKVADFTDSQEFTVGSTGWYCVTLVGGGGAWNSELTRNGSMRPGGKSSLKIDGMDYLVSPGGQTEIQSVYEFPYFSYSPPREYSVRNPVEIVSLDPKGACVLREHSGMVTMYDYHPGGILGIPRPTTDTVKAPAYLYRLQGCSTIIYLPKGKKLQIDIGAGGSHDVIPSRGKPGKGAIYFLGEDPWYMKS